MLEEIIDDVQQQMEKAIEVLRRDLAGLRTGRATASLLDGIRIDYYGTPTPLNQLASVSVPEPRMLTVKPYEQSLIAEIEKVIRSEPSLGLNPSNDGTLIRLPIPELTEERRHDLVKIGRQRAEEGRVAVRHARRDGLDLVADAKNDGEISEDEGRLAQDKIQKLTDDYVKKSEDTIAQKEVDIMEVG